MEKTEKQEIIKKWAKNEKDSGSARIQIALLTGRIKKLTEHLKSHKKDVHSRYGLMKMVGHRRKLLRYLSRIDYKKFLELKKELGIR